MPTVDNKPVSVGAMPGGKKGYTKMLRATWDWLSESSRTVADFPVWFAQHNWKKPTAANQTRGFLVSIGLIVQHKDGTLHAPPGDRSDESIIRTLHHGRSFIGDMLRQVAQ